MTPSKGGLRTQFSFTNVPRARPIRAHTCSAITRRLCGWLGASGTHDLRAQSEAPAEQPAVARTAVELHGCCASWVSLAEALLSQHVDCVTRAGSPGTESGSRARCLLLVLLTMLAPVVENRTVGGSASKGSTTKRTRKSPTEVPPAGPTARGCAGGTSVGRICQLPASARSS
jgi:hypothetical protein